MQRTNSKKRSALIVLIVALMVIAAAVTYTVAKYITTENNQYGTRVAKWDVSVEKASSSFDLFATAAATEGSENIIAPGTEGAFTYELTNNSEVKASYSVAYTVSEAGVYLIWSVDGVNWSDNLADISGVAIDMGETVSNTIYWKWSFEGASSAVSNGQTDANDTALGLGGIASPNVGIAVTFVQVSE